MIAKCFNMVFSPLIKLYNIANSLDAPVNAPQSILKNTTESDEFRAKILERIMLAQSRNKDLMLNREEAAAFLSIKIGTLAMWKSNKRYALPYIKVGRHIRYRSSDLINFLESKVNA
jgi:hypothetical protein